MKQKPVASANENGVFVKGRKIMYLKTQVYTPTKDGLKKKVFVDAISATTLIREVKSREDHVDKLLNDIVNNKQIF